MHLNAEDLEVAYYVFSRFINGRVAAGKSVPAAVLPLFRRIELVSACGHESDSGIGELDEEPPIGTAEAACGWLRRCRVAGGVGARMRAG